MSVIPYCTECNPAETGVYAVRIPDPDCEILLLDRFLMWFDGSWQYCGSDQRYRGEVAGWIGPLQRKMKRETR